ncbi:MAG: NAD(P)-binding protein, partial [Muribaculaceae bacterium]|nr:NAD(P)-binding protein [Muribaculaceae bacterium]
MSRVDVIIAGGGLGGLFTGALLAHNGLMVTVLEKNAIPGGGLQSFSRDGVMYDTGMHVMGGWRQGGTLDKITRYLCIRDKLDIAEINDGCMDQVTSLADAVTYKIPAGREAFIDALAQYFPSEREGLEQYVAAIERITDSFDLYNLRPYSHSASFEMLPEAIIPADELIARYINDARLRSLLAYNNGLYNGEAGRTPAYVHALISVLYMKGASRFVGNSVQLARALAEVIAANGGSVL